VLSGEGGDELFGGYGRYRRLLRPRIFGGRPMRQTGIFDALDILTNSSSDWRAGIEGAKAEIARQGLSKLQAAQAEDCEDWLAHDLLLKLDRCLMAHGVEGRTPMLDPAVAAVAFNLPDRLKIQGRHGKYILRKWLSEILPEAAPFTRKRGFTVPVAEWIGGRGRAIGQLVADAPAVREICRPGRVQEFFARLEAGGKGHQGQAAWTLLYYALWHRIHMEGAPADGSAFDVLSGAG